MLSRFVIAFLPRSKHFLISWLWSPSAVILEPKEIKPFTVSTSICHEVMGLDPMILVFGSCSLLQEISPTQGLNPGLPHCKWILYQLSHKGSLVIDEGKDSEARKYSLGLDLEGGFWEAGSGNEKCNVYKN